MDNKYYTLDKSELYFHSVFQILADLLQDCKAGVKSLKLEQKKKYIFYPKMTICPFSVSPSFLGVGSWKKGKYLNQKLVMEGERLFLNTSSIMI